MRDRLLGDLTSEPSPDPGTLALRARGAQEVDMGSVRAWSDLAADRGDDADSTGLTAAESARAVG